jgi:hypothetical protein
MGRKNKLEKSFEWLYKQAKRSLSKKKKDQSPSDIKSISEVSKKVKPYYLYFHIYSDPLYKDKLPYWDALPLYFPLELYGGGHGSGAKIGAFNIHYLKPEARAKFMGEIIKEIESVAEKKGYDPFDLDSVPEEVVAKIVGKYLESVYQGMSSAGSHIRECYRMYLFNRISSKIIRIKVSEWQHAVDLVLPKWQGAGQGTIYKDISSLYTKYKGNSRESIY